MHRTKFLKRLFSVKSLIIVPFAAIVVMGAFPVDPSSHAEPKPTTTTSAPCAEETTTVPETTTTVADNETTSSTSTSTTTTTPPVTTTTEPSATSTTSTTTTEPATDADGCGESTTTTSTSTTTTTTVPDNGMSDTEVKVNCDTMITFSLGQEFTQDQVKCGDREVPGAVVPPVNPVVANDQRGSAAFSKVTIKNHAELCAFIHADTPESQAIRERALLVLGSQPDEFARWSNCEGFLPLQYTVEIDIIGTTMFADGQVIDLTHARRAGAMDMFWLFFKKDGTLVPMASLRAACGNVSIANIKPVHPTSPPEKTIEEVPTKQEVKDSKCALAARLNVLCGSPDGGPEHLPVQSNPSGWIHPTPGGLPAGNAEVIVPQQVPVPGADPLKPTPVGTDTPIATPTDPKATYEGPGSNSPTPAQPNLGVSADPKGTDATHDNPLVGETAPAGSTAPDF